ncbi:hypothetical protein [uncultured Mediterranean phage]|nr:hypothetical protein [uncultured Mediterranean phage]
MTDKNTYFLPMNLSFIRLTSIISPLLLWTYIWYRWGGLSSFNISLKEQKKRLTKGYIASKIGMNIGKYWHSFNYFLLIFRRLVFIGALLFPFIYTVSNFRKLYMKSPHIKSKTTPHTDHEKTLRVGLCIDPCFKKITDKRLTDMGIMAMTDMECQQNVATCTSNTLQSIITASNIISLCIFLLVLLIYRQIPSAWDKRKSLNHWVIISLLIGFIIQHTTIWSNINNWVTYWVSFTASILLSMNIAAFIIIISLISTQVFFEFF